MSGIAGFVGPAAPGVLDAMLGPISYRGDCSETATASGIGLGYRFWKGRPNKSQGVFKGPNGALVVAAGTLAPPVVSPAETLHARLTNRDFGGLDGAFAAARWEPRTSTLTLLRDPFGIRSVYYLEHHGVFYFATELKQLLAIPSLPVALDEAAVHKYLTFSFFPGDATPIRGIRRLAPGHVLRFNGSISIEPWFELREEISPIDQKDAARQVWHLGREAVERRLGGEDRVGLYLSGGLDSSAVGVWLKELNANVSAFTLDFGQDSVEREQAEQVAAHLSFPLERVKVDGAALFKIFEDLVWKLDLPFGDPVTGPHYLLGRSARAAGLNAVFNGEGGDQLYGGWTSKPMVAAAVYGSAYGEASPEQQYLKSYHRFYGLEEQLYTQSFASQVGSAGQRRALVAKHLGGDSAHALLNRIRLTDIGLKGSQNILPRAERMSNAHGLDMRVPLFDRQLEEASFRLPTELKLNGACEKYVLKLAMQNRLPDDIVWRRKFGMSVPVTDWLFGALRPLVEAHLNSKAVLHRGLFRPEFIAQLRSGTGLPSETRRRRMGEKLWTLLMLEAWLVRFVDRRGNFP
jgi:asparagine synthase (glutamine-hydrolysing)